MLSVCLSVCLSNGLFVLREICLSVFHAVCLFVCPTVCSSWEQFVRLSFMLSVHPSCCLSVYHAVCLSFMLSVCPSCCLSFLHAVCLSACPTVCSSCKQWKGINRKQSTRWQQLSKLKASAFFSLQIFLVVMKHSNLYLGLVLPSGGWQSLISVCLPVNPSVFQPRLYVGLSVCLSVRLSIHPPLSQSAHLYLFSNLSVCLYLPPPLQSCPWSWLASLQPFCLSVCLSMCPFILLPVPPSVCSSV